MKIQAAPNALLVDDPLDAQGWSLAQCIAQAEACLASGQVQQGIAIYQHWLEQSDSSEAFVGWFNLGALLSSQLNWPAAKQAYEQSIALAPDFAEARINLGLVLESRREFGEALRQWVHIVASRWLPNGASQELQIAALNHMSRVYEAQKNYSLANKTLQHSLELQPAQPDALQHWVFLQCKQCNWVNPEISGHIRPYEVLQSTSPLAMLAMHDDPSLQLLASQNWVKRKLVFKQERLATAPSTFKQKIRVGYMSGDLCTHAVGLVLAELIEAHDRSVFDVYAFDYSPEDGSVHRTRLVNAFDAFVSIQGMSDSLAAQAIAQNEIDILIDLHGLSHGARPGILALRPARNQGAYLGFIGTTAMPWIDFVIADRFVLPDDLLPFMSERPMYVDGCFMPVVKTKPVPKWLTRESVGLPEKARVLACFNNVYKITAPIFKSWMQVLHEVDDAVLWLLDDNPDATQNLKEQVVLHGINPSRVIFAARTSYEMYCQRLTLADIYLDTYPYNAGSTARDVLSSRVPLVTLCGKTMVSRMAASMLQSLGLEDLITNNLTSYLERITQLAKGRRLTQSYRKTLTHALTLQKTAPQKWARSLEQQFQKLVRS